MAMVRVVGDISVLDHDTVNYTDGILDKLIDILLYLVMSCYDFWIVKEIPSQSVATESQCWQNTPLSEFYLAVYERGVISGCCCVLPCIGYYYTGLMHKKSAKNLAFSQVSKVITSYLTGNTNLFGRFSKYVYQFSCRAKMIPSIKVSATL